MTAAGIDKIIETTSAFRLISDPTRCRIILLLSKGKDGMCVHELAGEVNISHSAASHQLAKLEARGMVTAFPMGKKVCYRLNNTAFVKNVLRVMNIFKM